MVIGLSYGVNAGYAINPARDLGPRLFAYALGWSHLALRTVLVDKADVGGGTTSRSTRLIHGGLRYLEHFEVPLVRESLHERDALQRNAPHLVHPLHFLIPVYAEGAHREGAIRLAMLAYEVLSLGNHIADHHQMLSPEETLRLAPGLEPAGLRGSALYYDAQAVYPERLALETTSTCEPACRVPARWPPRYRTLSGPSWPPPSAISSCGVR